MRFICPCPRLSKETQTQIPMFFLLCCPRMFGSLAASPEFQWPPPKLGASCVCETQAAAPAREDTPGLPAPSWRKRPCVHRPYRWAKRRTAWKNSKMLAIVCSVSQKIKSIFLYQMRADVPCAETGKLARFPELFFMDMMENLMRKREI